MNFFTIVYLPVILIKFLLSLVIPDFLQTFIPFASLLIGIVISSVIILFVLFAIVQIGKQNNKDI